MKPLSRYGILVFAACLLLISCQKTITLKSGTVKLTFRNMVDTNAMLLDSDVYTNPFGETYTITKFKYYISNVRLGMSGSTSKAIEKDSYHLVDQSQPGSLSVSFDIEENTFSTLHFLLGVDSIRNVSGAQTGALDPLNDMFWTWNSGYIMAKMEGTSPMSNQVGNIIEYHIGGFSGINNTIKEISLTFPTGKILSISAGRTSEIILEADFNDWWQTPNDLKIAELPICTTPSVQAKNISDNYSKMFRITDVVNN